MLRRSILCLVIAGIAAALLAMKADRRGFEELAERAAIAEQANVPGTKCPLSREIIDKADTGLLSICLAYGLGAYEAGQRYPTSAAKAFTVYGEEETFRKVLEQYGHEIIPIIAFYVENGSGKLQIGQALDEVLHRMWIGQKPKWEPAKITREQIGLIAIYDLAARGHEMLAEFEIVGGVAKRKPVTSFFLGAKDLLFGGVGEVEKILVRGERLPTWKEVGLAVFDVTVVAGGVGAFAKVARVGGREAAEKSAGRLMAEGAFKAISTTGKAGARIAPIAFIYVAIERPSLLASLGGWIAEQFGFNRLVGIFAVYFIGIFLVLQFLRPLIWCGRIVIWAFRPLRHIFTKSPGHLRVEAALRGA